MTSTAMSRFGLAAAIAAGLALLGPHQVPLYDGVGFPDQPYRYVQRPLNDTVKTPPPGTDHGQLKLAGGVNVSELSMWTDELGPQITMYLPLRALQVDNRQASGSIEATLAPVRLVGAPTDGVPNSNVYSVQFTSSAGPVTARPHSADGHVTLREATFDLPLPIMNFRPAGATSWRQLPTTQQGRDIFDAIFAGPGDYLLVRPAGGPARHRSGQGNTLYLALGMSGLLMVLTLGGVRLLTRRSQP